MVQPRYLLGVDGGGSRTRAVLARLDDDNNVEVLRRGVAGPGNPLLAGHRQVRENLETATGQALAALPEQAPGIAYTVLALAGASGEAEKALINGWVDGHPLIHDFCLVPDWQPVLAAGTADGVGIGLIAGTGSVAFGRSQDGRIEKRGGWGHWFGDLGSGFDLGRQALTAIATAADGLTPETMLTAPVLQHLGADGPDQVTTILTRHDSPRRTIASLAPLVLEAAEIGDPAARAIRESGARYLASLVATTVSALGLDEGYALALAGSVICKNTPYRNQVLDELARIGPVPGAINRVDEPVMGAITIARKALHNTEHTWSHHA